MLPELDEVRPELGRPRTTRLPLDTLAIRSDPQGAGRLRGVKVHDSALKHGVLPEDAVQAADWPLWVEPLAEGGWPHRELRLGLHTQGRLLETAV